MNNRSKIRDELLIILLTYYRKMASPPKGWIAPNGEYLTSGGYDCSVKIWKVFNWEEIKTLFYPKSVIHSVAFSPNSYPPLKKIGSIFGARTTQPSYIIKNRLKG